jgi:hypothetical protein
VPQKKSYRMNVQGTRSEKDTHLREFYLRLKHKHGEKKALVAVARKISYMRILDDEE